MKTTMCNDMESCSCFGEGGEDKKDSKVNMKDGMEKCMKGAKWFMLIPGLILITAFVLTYFLDPDVVKTLWLVITGTLVGLGLLFMTLNSLWFRNTKKEVNV